ncbi:MAG: phosphoribosylanthranilate isomerase [Eubacterium sp.]|nr:phosphoribosylanthranilate isomerase [Eubacterium sp.]
MNIKLCGMMSRADAMSALELRPQYIGFILCNRFKRYIAPNEVARIRHEADWPPEIKAVGVFVDQEINDVADIINSGTVDVAQLHGNENEDYIKKLRELTGNPVIKAFKIETKDDVEKAVKSPADLILLDAGTGAGQTFDWSLVGDVSRDFILAGGLNPDNVAAAISMIHPYGVDVSSGIETEGKKDKKKMRAFVEACTNAL